MEASGLLPKFQKCKKAVVPLANPAEINMKNKKVYIHWVVVVHAFNLRSGRQISKFEAIQVYKVKFQDSQE